MVLSLSSNTRFVNVGLWFEVPLVIKTVAHSRHINSLSIAAKNAAMLRLLMCLECATVVIAMPQHVDELLKSQSPYLQDNSYIIFNTLGHAMLTHLECIGNYAIVLLTNAISLYSSTHLLVFHQLNMCRTGLGVS